MNEINWIEGNDEDGYPTIDPQDGEEPFCVWWEDVRGSEVSNLVIRAYERGVKRGRRELELIGKWLKENYKKTK